MLHDTIDAQNKGAGFCLYRDDYIDPNTMDDGWSELELSGIQCTGVYAASVNYADTFSTYWFPEAMITTILPLLEAGTLDLFSSDYDDYIISDNYSGMSHF